MKYYYNGQLIRTSKTRTYTHAVLYNGKCRACSGSYELARKALAQCQSYTTEAIRDSKDAIAAIERGSSHYRPRRRGGSFLVRVTTTKEGYLARIADLEKYLEGWEIVELEARA